MKRWQQLKHGGGAPEYQLLQLNDFEAENEKLTKIEEAAADRAEAILLNEIEGAKEKATDIEVASHEEEATAAVGKRHRHIKSLWYGSFLGIAAYRRWIVCW
jgi:hypothetical protein